MALIHKPLPPDPKQLRRFVGIVLPLTTLFPAVFLAMLSQNWKLFGPLALAPVGAALSLLVLAIPRMAKPLWYSVHWSSFAISWLISAIILIVLYYGVMLPTAVLLRMAGWKTPVGRRPAANGDTYWQPPSAATTKSSVFRQF